MTYGERLKEINNLLSSDWRGEGGRDILTAYIYLKAINTKDRVELFKIVLVYNQD